MKVIKEDVSTLQVLLNIELEVDELEPYLERSYKRLVNRARIPGFRRGKAPRHLVESVLGREAMIQESLDYIAQQSIDKAIESEALEIFGEPDVELISMDPVSFKAMVPLNPIVDLTDYRKIDRKMETEEIPEQRVEEVLEQIRYESAPWEPSDNPISFGNLVTLDVDGSVEGQKIAEDRGVTFIPQLENENPLPGFSVHIEGLVAGREKEFEINVPGDYQEQSIAGKTCRFKVKIHEIKQKILAELDDEFAKGVGEGYGSLIELRDKLRDGLVAEATQTAVKAFREKLFDEVVENSDITISELTINREVGHIMEERNNALKRHNMDVDTYMRGIGKSDEEIKLETKVAAEDRIKRAVIMRNLADNEGITVSSEDVDKEISALSGESESSEKSIRNLLSSVAARNSLASAILMRRVLERLAVIAEGSPQDNAEAGTAEEISSK